MLSKYASAGSNILRLVDYIGKRLMFSHVNDSSGKKPRGDRGEKGSVCLNGGFHATGICNSAATPAPNSIPTSPAIRCNASACTLLHNILLIVSGVVDITF